MSGDYSAQWAAREEVYAKAPSDSARGAGAVLAAFNAYRRSGPSWGGVEDWLRTRHSVHQSRLVDLGVDPKRLPAMVAGREKPPTHGRLAFNIGALREVRRLYREAAAFRAGQTPGAAERNASAASPSLPGDVNPMLRGVLKGVGSALGR